MDKDIFLKRYEKVTFLRFFALFFGAFMLMFLLLGTLHYLKERQVLRQDAEFEYRMEYGACTSLEMADCSHIQPKSIDLTEVYHDLLWALLLILLLFIPITVFLSFFALKPVRQASMMIDNFIANIVHDINTPIATIMLNAKSLLKKSKEEPKKLKRILSSAKQLTDMQHDLLALADENSEIEKEKIDLKNLTQEIIAGFQLQYPTQTFKEKVNKQVLWVNPVDLRRILQNLISNAVKYNQDNNPITIYSQEALLIIKDQGKGMAHPEKVFEKNYREDYSIQGNGLGLASVLSMLERNNIKIDVESKLNIGTQITLNFY